MQRNRSTFYLNSLLKLEHNLEILTIPQEAFSMTHLILTLGTAFLLTVGAVWAGPVEDTATATSFKQFQSLAAQGNAEAQNNLGQLYASGRGVPQDYSQARQWYEKASAQGHALAQNNLAELYYAGLGVPQDDVRAYMWVSLAAIHMKGEEQKQATENRDDVARRMTPAQIAEANRLTQQCLTRKFKNC